MSEKRKKTSRRSIGQTIRPTVTFIDDSFQQEPLSGELSSTNGGSGGMEANELLQLVPENDDSRERQRRRRSMRTNDQQYQISSPQVASRVQTLASTTLSAFSTTQLADHYANCIKLSTENKITIKNAFTLHLIDYMAEMLKKKNSDMDNLQLASCTLDASAKIYGYRVDCIHAKTQKIANNLTRTEKRNKSDSDLEGNEDGNNIDEDNLHKKTKKKKGGTIETNINALNVQKIDQQFEVDPLFQKTSELFAECGSGRGILLANLLCRDDSCELILDSAESIQEKETQGYECSQQTASVHITELFDIFKKIESGSFQICSEFRDFEFGSWNQNNSLGKNWKFSEDANICEDLDTDDENPLCHSDPKNDTDQRSLDVLPIETSHLEDASNARPSSSLKIMDLTQMLSMKPNEYSYFNKEFSTAWAGPSHWHIRPLPRITNEIKPRKPHVKKVVPSIEFDKDLTELDNHFITGKTSVLLNKATRQRWQENNTLPDNIHYDVKQTVQLYLEPMLMIKEKHQPVEGADKSLEEYNYDNINDVTNFCPDADDLRNSSHSTTNDSLITNNDANAEIATQQNFVAFTGDNLVQPPPKVAKFDIPYEKTAKRINVKLAKENMWSVLNASTTVECENPRLPTPEPTELSFCNAYHRLLDSMPSESEQKANMSIPIGFAIMLYLANEKNLTLKQHPELSDFTIRLPHIQELNSVEQN